MLLSKVTNSESSHFSEVQFFQPTGRLRAHAVRVPVRSKNETRARSTAPYSPSDGRPKLVTQKGQREREKHKEGELGGGEATVNTTMLK